MELRKKRWAEHMAQMRQEEKYWQALAEGT